MAFDDATDLGRTHAVSLGKRGLGGADSGKKPNLNNIVRGQLGASAAPTVLNLCHRLKVMGIAADSIAAKVVKFGTGRYCPFDHFVQNAVRVAHAVGFGIPRQAVAAVAGSTLPDPAASRANRVSGAPWLASVLLKHQQGLAAMRVAPDCGKSVDTAESVDLLRPGRYVRKCMF